MRSFYSFIFLLTFLFGTGGSALVAQCTANAGSATPDQSPVMLPNGGQPATISATPDGNAVVPTDPGYALTYVVTFQNTNGDLVIVGTSSMATFQTSQAGTYRIHPLAAQTGDANAADYLDLTTVQPGITTAAQVLADIMNSGLCADLATGAEAALVQVNEDANCTAEAATTIPSTQTVNIDPNTNMATISAQATISAVVPPNFTLFYVLTNGPDGNYELQQDVTPLNTTGTFTVDALGTYYIHAVVANVENPGSPDYVDVSSVVEGNNASDVVTMFITSGVCHSIDLAGAERNVQSTSTMQCAAESGSATPDMTPVTLTNNQPSTISATADGNANVPAGYSLLYVLTFENSINGDLVVVGTNASGSFDVTQFGTYRIHPLVAQTNDPNGADYLDLTTVEFGETTAAEVLLLISQSGLCADLATGTDAATIQVERDPACAAEAGTTQPADQTVQLDATSGTVTISAQASSTAVVPTNFTQYYVLTSGPMDDYTLLGLPNTTGSYTVSSPGMYFIHSVVANFDNPGASDFADLSNIQIGDDASDILMEFFAQNISCYSIDLGGAKRTVQAAGGGGCQAEAGSASADASPVALQNNGVATTISATPSGQNVPADYELRYVLTFENDINGELVIVALSDMPSFGVTQEGTYRIHPLVAEITDSSSPDFLDVGQIVPGETTASDVLDLIADNGLCADLATGADAAIIQVNNGNCMAEAGTTQPQNQTVAIGLNGMAVISAQASSGAVVPPGYNQIYVLTGGPSQDYEILGEDNGSGMLAVNTSGSFTVTAPGIYFIHSVVLDITENPGDPFDNFFDVSQVDIGDDAADIVGMFFDAGVCYSIDLGGARRVVTLPNGFVCNADNGQIAPAGPVTVCAGDDSPEFTTTYAGGDIDPNAAAMFPATPRLNEIRLDQPGADNDEYFEIFGQPGTSLANLTLIVLGDGPGDDGTIENVTDLTGVIPADGAYLVAETSFTLNGQTPDQVANINLENSDNVTYLLVEDFTGALNDDLDTDNDGTLDAMPWSNMLDIIALVETPGAGEQVYGPNQIGPSGTFVPAHIYRDGAGTWQIGAFTPGASTETPGLPNVSTTDFALVYVLTEGTDGLGDIVDVVNGTPQPNYPGVFTNPAPGEYTVVALSIAGSFQDFTDEDFATGQEIQDRINANTLCAEYDVTEGVALTVVNDLTVSGVIVGGCTTMDASSNFTVSFRVSGGQGPITINGQDITSNTFTQGSVIFNADQSAFTFTSNMLASGTTYSFTVSDAAAACADPAVVIGTFSCDPCFGFEAPNPAGAEVACAGSDVILFAAGGGTPVPADAGGLFFSEYIEGSGVNKAVEIFNGTGADVDLTDYAIELYSNGSATPSNTFDLTGIITDNDVFVFADDGADAAILAETDQTTTSSLWNGDDAVVLTLNGTPVDIIGTIGTDPGSQWFNGTIGTANETIVRMPTVTEGDTDGSNDFADDLTAQWMGTATNNDFSDLGTHNFTATQPDFDFEYVFVDAVGTEIGRVASMDGDTVRLNIGQLTIGTYNFAVRAESTTPACVSTETPITFTVTDQPLLGLPDDMSTGVCIEDLTNDNGTINGNLNLTFSPTGGSGTYTLNATVLAGGTTTTGVTATAAGSGSTMPSVVIAADENATVGTFQVEITATDGNGCTSDPLVLTINVDDCEVDISDPCDCLNNATTLDDGQFAEEITVSGPTGQTWTVVAASGLLVSEADPTPIPAGTVLTEDPAGSGMYVLTGVHVDGQGYSVTVANGQGDVLTIGNTCFYPTPIIEDLPASACISNDAIPLTFSEAFGAAGTGSFQILDAAGNVIEDDATEFDASALGFGQYFIVLTFDAGDPTPSNGNSIAAAQADPGCIQSITQGIEVLTSQDLLACNDNVVISLDENCEAVITPDMVMEFPGCSDDYQVTIQQGFTQLGNTVTADQIGVNNLIYRVTYLPTGNFCWGNLTVEDKLGPVIDCAPITAPLNCFDDLATAVPVPTAIDACEGPVPVQLVEEVIDDSNQCTTGVVVTRTYIAFDSQGRQSAPCVQTFVIQTPALPSFPEDIEFNCVQFAAFPSITNDAPLLPTITDSDPSTPFLTVSPNVPDFQLQLTGAGTVDVASGLYCPFAVASNDDTLATSCPGSFKILRTFTVLNWCTGELITTGLNGGDNVQVIKVTDNVAPTLSVPTVPVTVNANVFGQHPQVCRFVGNLPLPITVSDACGGVDGVVGAFLGGQGVGITVDPLTGAGTINVPAPGLPVGTTGTLNLTVNDLCGNIATGTLSVNVVDNIVPTMVCDEITQVTLTNNGTATVLAQVYDDGTYDNCCLEELSVRRLNAAMQPTTPFGPSVTFGCADVGQSNLVELRAVDCFGNFNTCMVETLVDDKSQVNIQCPTTTSVSCLDFLTIAAQLEALEDGTTVGEQAQLNLINTTFGFDSALGTGFGAICGQNDDVSVSFSLENCDDMVSNGISITFTTTAANDPTNNASVTCFVPIDNVVDWDVRFPENQTRFCTDTDGFTVDLDNLAAEFGEPEFINNGCPQQLAFNEEVEVFTSAPDACYKIVRTFTAINWCEAVAPFDDLNGTDDTDLDDSGETGVDAGIDFGGIYLDGDDADNVFEYSTANGGNQIGTDNVIRYAQVIKINDNVAPVVQAPVPVTTEGSLTICSGSATLTRPVADDCVDDDDLVYAYAIVEVGGAPVAGGTGLFTGLTETIALDFGTYAVAYEVSDQCGNATIVDGGTFTVADEKKPTPVCMNGLVIGIMQTGMIDISASLLDKGSFDNCTDDADLLLSFSPNPADSILTLTCDDVGQVQLSLYVTDEAGNQDFCTQFIIVQDNMGVCGGDPLVIGGSLRTEAGAGVGDAQVEISGMNDNTLTTGTDGTFQFENLPAGGDYTITPSKDIGVRNGVTSLDLFLMTRHALGLQPLDSPYKIIAADVNNSGSVTALDIVSARAVILFLQDEFPNNTSWRFVEADYDFVNDAMPLMEDFPEVFNVNNLTGQVLDAEFIGIKIGDVNGSATPSMLHDGGAAADDRFDGGDLPFQTQDRAFRAGETFQVTLTAAETSNWLGAQGTLAFSDLELTKVLPHGDWTAADFGTAHARNQRLTFAHVTEGDAATLNADAALFTLEFQALANGTLSNALRLSNDLTTNEGYDATGNRRKLTLGFLPADDAADAFVLYQNRPNPFAEETVIAFHLPTQAEVTLRVFDAAGREILTRRADFDAGKQQFLVKGDELSTKGMLLYRLESEHGSLLGKMVRE